VVTEQQVCLATLKAIFASGCETNGQMVPCICGSTNTAACEADMATPTGDIWPYYECDFNATKASTVITDLVLPMFGAGVADSIIECVQQNGCSCYGM
jgi:hypothetical protein